MVFIMYYIKIDKLILWSNYHWLEVWLFWFRFINWMPPSIRDGSVAPSSSHTLHSYFKNATQKLSQLQFSECSKAMSWLNPSSLTQKQRQRAKTSFVLDVESPWPYMFLIHDIYLFVCHRGKDWDRNGPLKAKPWGWELWRAGIRHAQSVPPFQISFTGLSTWTGFS